MKKALTITLVFCLALSFLGGCQKDNAIAPVDNSKFDTLANQVEISDTTVTFTDANGDKTTLNKNPKRVISLYNSYTDLWYAAGGEVAGRISSTSNLPEEALEAEVVGSMTQPNAEKIVEMKPDLVIIRPFKTGQRELIPILNENKIPYLAVEYNTFAEYLHYTRVFTALNKREDLYQSIGLDIKTSIDEIVSKAPKEDKPSVLIMFATTRGVSVRLPNTSVGEMLQDLNTQNIAYSNKLSEAEMQIFSLEKIVEKDPDFIFVQTMGEVEKIKEKLIKDVESNPAWKTLKAVKEKRYVLLPKELYLYKANTRYAEAYEYLAKILYPETFK